jgi:hypothetical protein
MNSQKDTLPFLCNGTLPWLSTDEWEFLRVFSTKRVRQKITKGGSKRQQKKTHEYGLEVTDLTFRAPLVRRERGDSGYLSGNGHPGTKEPREHYGTP